jgi:uncharacterized YigZ family protein
MKTREKPASDLTWLAPARPARDEIRVRGSRFLGVAAPVVSEEEAAGHLQALREEFPRATHHCWAFRIRHGEELVERSSDMGEPSGTAGLPILRALESAGLEGVSLVVVRWFGGTKLGIGPLARAYREAAAAALAIAGSERRRFHRLFRVRFPHTLSSEVRRALARLDGQVREERHGAAAELVVGIPCHRAGALGRTLADASRGQAEVEEGELVAVRVDG